MYYSLIALVALVVNLILNWKYIRLIFSKADAKSEDQRIGIRYSHFLHAANLFFLAEIGWGIFYGNRDKPGFFTAIYCNTIFYFIFMLLTILTWSRYIVAYLDKNSIRFRALTTGAWIAFILSLVCLMLNRFYPFIFSFNEAHEYIAESGRYLVFTYLSLTYLITFAYMLAAAGKATGRQKIRCMAVACTSVALGISMFFQILYSYYPLYVIGLLIGICTVHSIVEVGEKQDKEIQDRIAQVMAEDYIAIYYIEVASGEYLEYAGRQKDFMDMPSSGKDFYAAFKSNIAQNAFVDDVEPATVSFEKETILKNLEGRRSFSCKYRFMVYGEPRFFLMTYMYAGDDKRHMVLYEKDINDELMAEKKRKESQKKTITFTQIAESLASNYDEIYYVDMTDDSYVSYESNNIYGQLEISRLGKDFYGESLVNIPQVIHKQDQESLLAFMDKDTMISGLEESKARSIDYRLVIDGKARYARMIVRKASDGTHFIIGVENIDNEIMREKQHLKALKTEKELARRDELTGTKNKTAYKELETSVQTNIENGMDYLPFALAVCDTNNLKMINDTLGHAAGDEYIKASAKLLCDTFVHSPVFRIGGDEFAVFLRGDDYVNRLELIDKLKKRVLKNKESGTGPILAVGISDYNPEKDTSVSDIFERADKEMYENKQKLKETDKKA
ncbi:GGDEF domain-containing protein [Butyrivibrio sp. FCS014]|uniref:GGDEF domain-containing protein n=1 Tax=Butyrivibrio sp. FCS014 TaxID=1408304 RepID=UPI000462FD21|nr:GGDEF domain-containing protein [Butyrivibrio sp. FCS014]